MITETRNADSLELLISTKSQEHVLRLYDKALSYKFDYENCKLNSFKIDKSSNSQAGTLVLKSNSPLIDYDNISDSFPDSFADKYYNCRYEFNGFANKLTNLIRHCVSGTRIRMIDNEFDLDLVYITKRVIAMGFPSDKPIESFYRNPVHKVRRFFKERLNDKVKVSSCIIFIYGKGI